MNNDSKRYAILLGIICVVFLVAVINAFLYLPKTNDTEDAEMIALNTPKITEQKFEEQKIAEEKPSEPEKGLNVELKADENINEINDPQTSDETGQVLDVSPEPSEPLEPVNISEAPETNAQAVIDETESAFIKAKNLKNDKQYVKAIEEYKNIIAQNPDLKVRARCYEEIATIYAIVKKYGSALSYAQRAYNLSPSSSREVLLARLYYKTGDLDKASTRINNVLKRDFSADRN